MAEQEILVVCASLIVHCCAVKKNVIVSSQLCDVADVQFTVEQTEWKKQTQPEPSREQSNRLELLFNLCGNKVTTM